MRLLGAASFCVAGAALGASPARFAWQAQHSEHLRFVLRGRCSTWSTFIEVGGSLATSDAFGSCLVLGSRRSTWSISVSFCMAGAALGAAQVRFAWQAQHLEHLRLVLRGRCSTGSISAAYCEPFFRAQTIHTTPTTVHHQTQHHQHTHQLHFIINTTSSTHHHLHNTIYTTSSTQHHLHYIIKHNIINTHISYISSSTQHHLHYIIKHYIINTDQLHNTSYTTSSTQHHLHYIIKHYIINTDQLHNTSYTTPSTQHHLHYII